MSGTVTFRGQPVVKGFLAMTPLDGKGPLVGGVILNGSYSVTKIQPGKKIVEFQGLIGTVADSGEPISSVDARQEAHRPTGRKKGRKQGGNDQVMIEPEAEGNYQQVEIVAGNQTRDFHLEPPAG